MPSWGELLAELQDRQSPEGDFIKALSLDELRYKYLANMYACTGRNVIAYYSGWLKPERKDNIDINDGDITGFMNAIKGMDCTKGLDLILHTPGGDPTATEGIVKYIHKKFGDIKVIIPQMAMSAGTMLACSAKTIIMGSHSCLGPIDPQFSGIPAYNILSEFREAKADLDAHENTKTYWELQLKKYPAAFYYKVQDSINLSSLLTGEWLETYMFSDLPKKEAKEKKRKILTRLNANNMSHSRHFTYDFCHDIGLNVKALEEDQILQECVLSVHHSFIITFEATKCTKIIENHDGARFVSRQPQ